MNEWLENTSVYRFKNEKVDVSLPTIRAVQQKILELQRSGFPSVYSPNLNTCPVCHSKLSSPCRHKEVLVSNLLSSGKLKSTLRLFLRRPEESIGEKEKDR